MSIERLQMSEMSKAICDLIRRDIEQAVKQENEACAEIVERWRDPTDKHQTKVMERISQAIRARK